MDQEKNTPIGNFIETSIPIFFVQMGGEPGLFLEKILKQAELTNGKENVYLLTNTNFDLYKNFNCIDTSKYSDATKNFDNLYKHHSTNTFMFEKVCFDRWFIINAVVKDRGIKYFFHADCDVLLLENINPIHQYIVDNNYAGSTMYFEKEGDSVTSGHSSFWSSNTLNDFCNFVCKKYASQQQFDILLKDTVAGKFLGNTNMSDMILLDEFRTEMKPTLFNLFTMEEDNSRTFDFNANVAYNGNKYTYELSNVFKIKRLTKQGDNWYGKVIGDYSDKPKVKFYTFHFQGYLTKSLIPMHAFAENRFEHISNYVLSVLTFITRKLRLFKTHIKNNIKRYLKMQ